jgi:Ca-activated chloride channel family protein
MFTNTNDSLTIEARLNRAVLATTPDEVVLLVRVKNHTARAASQPRDAVDVALVIDRSGSMSGAPLEGAKSGAIAALAHLSDTDRAAVVTYDDRVAVLAALRAMTNETVTSITRAIRAVESGGSTALADGWLTGCRQLADAPTQPDDDRRRKRAILLTDGLANVGETRATVLTRHAMELRRRGISTTTLGFGSGFDEHLLASMAEAGGGNFQYIAEVGQLPGFFERELGEMLAASVLDFSLDVIAPPTVRIELLSALPHEQTGERLTISAGDLGFSEEIELLIRLTSDGGRVGAHQTIEVRSRWFSAESDALHHGNFLLDLDRVPGDSVGSTPTDATVDAAYLRWLAAVDRRTAMELDRSGDHDQARTVLQSSMSRMAAAPASFELREELFITGDLLDADWSNGLSTETHKEVVARESRRARGRSVNPGESAERS